GVVGGGRDLPPVRAVGDLADARRVAGQDQQLRAGRRVPHGRRAHPRPRCAASARASDESLEAVAMRLPSGLNVAELTGAFPCETVATRRRVATSNTAAVPSWLAGTPRRPCREKRTATIRSAAAASDATSARVRTFHRRTCP